MIPPPSVLHTTNCVVSTVSNLYDYHSQIPRGFPYRSVRPRHSATLPEHFVTGGHER